MLLTVTALSKGTAAIGWWKNSITFTKSLKKSHIIKSFTHWVVRPILNQH